MTIQQKVEHELARLAPAVPSVSAMARSVDASRRQVARAYRQLGVETPLDPGRPLSGIFAEASVPVHFRIPAPIFDRYARAAEARNTPLASIFRAHILAAAPRLKA